MATIAVGRIKKEFQEVIKSDEVSVEGFHARTTSVDTSSQVFTNMS